MKRALPLLISFLLTLVVGNVFSQCNELIPLEVINPGFEGPTAAHITPAPWSTCGITPDTQPGSWGVTLPPSEGNSYVGFVYGSASWQEGASQALSGSMQAGVQYDFTIDLAATPASGGGLDPSQHCVMEVWGASAICQKTQLMWSSPLITAYTWETYNVSILPTQNWTHIYFICNCGPLGYILLDNITPLQANNPNVFITSHVDGDAESCGFTLAGNVNNAVIDSVILTGNFQGSPLATTMNGLDWSAPLTFNGPGNQTVIATAYYTDQQLQETCVSTHVDLIINSPASNFTFVSQCDGTAIPFTDASVPFGSNTITDWNWDFGDGTTSTQQNPTHTFSASGIYTVSLEITSSDGCAVTSSQDITVYENPVADFTFNEACEGDITDFWNVSSIGIGTIINQTWDFGDGNTSTVLNPSNTYSNLGVYDVQLTVTTSDGCIGSVTQQVGMFPLPVADFSFTDACLQSDFQLTDQSSVVTGAVTAWDWDFGDGGISTVQNPTNTYGADGTYNVTLTATTDHACTDVITQSITVYPLPVADFTNTTVCALITMDYTDASLVSSGTIAGWQWYFGDGSSATTQNPSHDFTTGGTYTSSLVVTTGFGCQDSAAIDVTVYPKPDAEFIPIDACLNDHNTFIDQSTIVGSNINGWNWDFGDNAGTSTIQNPIYTYTSSGQYTTELIATTADGCKDTVEQTVNVFDLPVADFNFTNICEDDSVLFVDQSTISSGAITGWNWDFGNGQTSSLQVSPYQSYPADNNYPVSLIVSSGFGCSDTLQDMIEIYPVPIAEFLFDSVCFPLEIQFTDVSDPNGSYAITSWNWTFSDGQTSALQSPSMDFGMPGTFSAELGISNGPGCKSFFAAGDAVVHPLPVADFPTDMATCLEDTIFFTDLSTITPITDDVIDQWTWNLADGNILNAQNGYHIYSTHNHYNVRLDVTTNHGCTDDVTHVVEIYPLPAVNFIADPPQGCAPLDVQFFDQTSIPNPYVLSTWDWYLGNDSTTSSSPSPFLTYDPELEPMDIAQYDIGLTVTSTNGCVSSIYKPAYVTVYPKPVAEFTVSPKVNNIIKPQFELTDLSTENVTQWDWSFGDGTYSSEQDPTHRYQAVGTYPIGLIVETQFGCKDTFGLEVKVEPVFTFYIPNSFTPDADGINDEFFGQGEGFNSYSMFIYDRWGEMIFESNNADHHWDGTYKGKQVEQGTYVYRFYIIDWQSDDHQYDGHVTLHR
ncbi:MAG: PKD domain-containing protein [Flavobacteriales bacterium]|nr:PKD domain-containing protein [Flavobacteriales bacterium]